jgi:hypothetical protein
MYRILVCLLTVLALTVTAQPAGAEEAGLSIIIVAFDKDEAQNTKIRSVIDTLKKQRYLVGELAVTSRPADAKTQIKVRTDLDAVTRQAIVEAVRTKWTDKVPVTEVDSLDTDKVKGLTAMVSLFDP